MHGFLSFSPRPVMLHSSHYCSNQQVNLYCTINFFNYKTEDLWLHERKVSCSNVAQVTRYLVNLVLLKFAVQVIKNSLLTHLKLFLIGSQIVLSFINLCTNYSVILSNCLFWYTQRNLCARCLILCYHGNHVLGGSGHSSTQVHTCSFAEAPIKASFFSMCTAITFIALQAIR